MYPPGGYGGYDPYGGFDPNALPQWVEQLRQQAQQPQPQPVPPRVTTPTAPAAPQPYTPPAPTGPAPDWMRNVQTSQGPMTGPVPRPVPVPGSAPTAPRTPQQTIESWHSWLGKQGLQQTRPGFYGTGGTSLADMVSRFNASSGGNARMVGRDKVDFGFGPVDVLTNSAGGGGNQEFWFNPSQVPGYRQPGGGGGGGGVPGGGGGGGVPSAPAAPKAVVDPRKNQLIDLLMKRATQGLDFGGDNPIIRQQREAYSANEERAKRNYLADLAEKSGPLANLRGETRLANERVGQRTGEFEAQLMGQELGARRQEIQQALTQAGAMLSDDQRMALQLQLAQMDDALGRLNLSQQESQFGRNLGQRESEFGRDLGYRYDAPYLNYIFG